MDDSGLERSARSLSCPGSQMWNVGQFRKNPAVGLDATLSVGPSDDRRAMGTVTELGPLREQREARALRIEEHAMRHPALRWVAGDVFYIAHRRTDDGTACGAEGDLVLSPPGVPLCSECYPGRGAS